MEANKRLSLIVTKLFLRGRKFDISLDFKSKYYFKVSKTVKLNPTHCFINKIPNKRELQQIGSNDLTDIEFKYLINLYKDYTEEQF